MNPVEAVLRAAGCAQRSPHPSNLRFMGGEFPDRSIRALMSFLPKGLGGGDTAGRVVTVLSLESNLTGLRNAATLCGVDVMTFLFGKQISAVCACRKAAATMWLHSRVIAGSPAVGRSV